MKKFFIIFAMFLFAAATLISCSNFNNDSDKYKPGDIFIDTEKDSDKQSSSNNDGSNDFNSSNSNVETDSDLIVVPDYITIVFSTDCGISYEDMKLEIGDNYSLPIPEQFNYKFLGWYYNDNPVASSGQWDIDGDIVELSAKWEKINEDIYKIIYDFNGGEKGGKDFPTYYDSTLDEKNKINTPIRGDGYKFIGWECNDTVTYSYKIVENTVGDIFLKALWYEYEYTYQDENGIQYFLKNDNTLSVVSYVGSVKDIFIPSTYNDYTVTEIGPYAFCGFEDKLASVQISGFIRCNIANTITKISVGAFTGCDDFKVQLQQENGEPTIEEWIDELTIEERNDHVLDVINGKRPAIGWKKYVIPGA